jgi:hypothetical protein
MGGIETVIPIQLVGADISEASFEVSPILLWSIIPGGEVADATQGTK